MPLQDVRTLIAFEHLRALTDEVGIVQFSLYGLPDPHSGYTTDDNARALVAATLGYAHGWNTLLPLVRRYLGFLRYAQREDGWFHNLVTYTRRFGDEKGSEDCVAQSLWGLATAVGCPALPLSLRLAAADMLQRVLPHIPKLRYPRAWAFALIGLCELQKQELVAFPEELCHTLANRLVELYRQNADARWAWFEPTLTYANAALCEALLRASQVTGTVAYADIAFQALEFLNRVCTVNGVIAPIGNRGWYHRGGPRPLFAQQPVDVFWLSWANWSAWQQTRTPHYLSVAQQAVRWFFGENLLGLPLYVPETGACHDGLEADGVNLNCGAESTICALLTLLRAAVESPLLEIPKAAAVLPPPLPQRVLLCATATRGNGIPDSAVPPHQTATALAFPADR